VKIKGIGRWTAEMFLIFSLNRPDVFPYDDLGVKTVMMRMYGFRKMPSKEKMIKIASKWAPHRTIGTWYLWQYANQGHLKKSLEKRKKS
jgi:DNA-3-methyladenine glycosylase II